MTISSNPESLPLFDELNWRDLLHQSTEGCWEMVKKGEATGYCGFDPTAESLHVGNLVSLMGLIRLARAGHKAIALIGGGTAMIGDPSGKSAERPVRSAEEIRHNARLIDSQVRRIAQAALGGSDDARFTVVDNAEWLTELKVIDFLRDTGKHFTINWMMQKDSVKSRMEGGISYTEFSYMLLQAHDFLRLHQEKGVTLQIGGSDQWGNITAGTELVRRSVQGEVHGYTFPLLTDSSGKKFGKTESGAVYLDASLTTPFSFYQFWINTEDAEVERLLKWFTLLSQTEISETVEQHLARPHERMAQKLLAREVTTLIHGSEAADLAETVSRTLFDKKANVHELADEVFEVMSKEVPSTQIKSGSAPGSSPAVANADVSSTSLNVVDVLEKVFPLSKTAARKLIQQGGISVNGVKVGADNMTLPHTDGVRGRWFLIRKGARDVAIAEIVL